MDRATIWASAALLLASGMASAQYVPPQGSPYGNSAYSPYVNLLQNRGNAGFNPAVTYMGIVQPQLQAQANFQTLQSEINYNRAVQTSVAPPRNGGVADTGYAPARFLQYQQYFNTLSSSRRVNNQTTPGTNTATFGMMR